MPEIYLALENWETESNQYLLIGRKIEDVATKKVFVIERYSDRSGLELKQVPYFKKQEPELLPIEFSELLEAYKAGAMTIEGFTEGQAKELSAAIFSLKSKLNIYFTSIDLEEKKATLAAIEKDKQDKIDAENAEIARLAEEQRLKEEREAKEAIEKEERIKREKENREKEKLFDKEIELDILMATVSNN